MRIAICDDNEIQVQLLDEAVSACALLGDNQLEVDTYFSGDALISAVRAGADYSYIFLDIEMPGKTGLELYTELAESGAIVIFVSTHMEYLPEVFSLKPYGFLAKPYTQDTFDRTIRSAVKKLSEVRYFEYKDGRAEKAIPCADIIFFEAISHGLLMHTISRRIFLPRVLIDDVDFQLSDYGFFRCKRSHLVNLLHCIERNGSEIVFKNGYSSRSVNIAKRKLSDFDKQLISYKTGGKQEL
jgi:DNA-binding LytR/AlgR family response regulator